MSWAASPEDLLSVADMMLGITRVRAHDEDDGAGTQREIT